MFILAFSLLSQRFRDWRLAQKRKTIFSSGRFLECNGIRRNRINSCHSFWREFHELALMQLRRQCKLDANAILAIPAIPAHFVNDQLVTFEWDSVHSQVVHFTQELHELQELRELRIESFYVCATRTLDGALAKRTRDGHAIRKLICGYCQWWNEILYYLVHFNGVVHLTWPARSPANDWANDWAKERTGERAKERAKERTNGRAKHNCETKRSCVAGLSIRTNFAKTANSLWQQLTSCCCCCCLQRERENINRQSWLFAAISSIESIECGRNCIYLSIIIWTLVWSGAIPALSIC